MDNTVINLEAIVESALKASPEEKLELLADSGCHICKGVGWIPAKALGVDQGSHFYLVDTDKRQICVCVQVESGRYKKR